MKTNVIITALALLGTLFACDSQDEVAPVIDQEKETVANGIAPDAWKRSLQPNAKVGGQIASEQQIDINVPAGGKYETWYHLKPGYALTGVGLGMTHGTVTGLRIEERLIKSNGKLGSPEIKDFGGGVYTTEVWRVAPAGHVITGVKVDAQDSENIKALRIYHRKLSGGFAIGSVKVGATEFSSQDGIPIGSWGSSYRTANYSSNVSKTVVSGIAFGYHSGQLFMGIAQAKLKGPVLKPAF